MFDGVIGSFNFMDFGFWNTVQFWLVVLNVTQNESMIVDFY